MASRERDRASAGMFRRSLADTARAKGAATDCPPPDILAAYYERSLDAPEIASCELHFSQCARCREQLTALARADESAAARREMPQPRAGVAWLWNWRWLAPAAAVLAIAIVWVARRPAAPHTTGETSPPLLAVSRPLEPQVSAPERKSLAESRLSVPRERSAIPPAARADSDLSFDMARSEPPQQLTAPAPGKESVPGLPFNGRNDAKLDALAKADEAPNRATANEVVAGAAGPKISSDARETLYSSASVAPPAAPASGERVMVTTEQEAIQSNASAGALTAKQAASPNPAKAKQAPPAPMVSGYSTKAESVVVFSADQRSAETLIRTPDPSVLWRLAPGGFVERSLDGGTTWQGQAINAEAPVVAGSAPTAKVCWLVGPNGIILLTRDGTTWMTVPPPVHADFVGVSAVDASAAIVTASDGRKFSTGDTGKHWNALP